MTANLHFTTIITCLFLKTCYYDWFSGILIKCIGKNRGIINMAFLHIMFSQTIKFMSSDSRFIKSENS